MGEYYDDAYLPGHSSRKKDKNRIDRDIPPEDTFKLACYYLKKLGVPYEEVPDLAQLVFVLDVRPSKRSMLKIAKNHYWNRKKIASLTGEVEILDKYRGHDDIDFADWLERMTSVNPQVGKVIEGVVRYNSKVEAASFAGLSSSYVLDILRQLGDSEHLKDRASKFLSDIADLVEELSLVLAELNDKREKLSNLSSTHLLMETLRNGG